MKITDVESNTLVNVLDLCLTTAEVQQLRDALSDLLEKRRFGADYHHHVSSSDYQTELSVWMSDDE